MTLWNPAPVAWVWQLDDILVVPVDCPLQQPLRLTGSAVDCWVALLQAGEPTSARTLAMTLLSEPAAIDANRASFDSAAIDIQDFLSSLAAAGIVAAE